MNSPHDLSTASTFWEEKPAWCQPWSILLSGIFVLITSWLLFHLVWLTMALTLVVIVWWTLFLVIVPVAYEQSKQT